MLPDAAAPPHEAPRAPRLPLDPAIRTLWRLEGALAYGLLVLTAAVVLVSLDLPWWLAGLAAAAAVLHVAVVPEKRYARFAYTVGEVELRVERGWLWRAESVVLHSRVQHVDTRQGPIERALGLATVVVFTAGTVGAMVAIPGLRPGDADLLRDRLVALSGSGDAV